MPASITTSNPVAIRTVTSTRFSFISTSRDNWSYVFQSNLIDNDVLLGSTEDAVSWNNYLFYTINDCWKLGARLEWFKDPRIQHTDGTAVQPTKSST